MNVVNSGNTFRIYGEDLKTYKELPIGTYRVNFNMMEGFSLELHDDLETREEKIYGSTMSRIDKVLSAFAETNRNLGVILSGVKGSGKSLFTRALSGIAGEQHNLPTILVNFYADGLEHFISSIKQEVIVIFDEFEKNFRDEGGQQKLLSLFDGVDAGKKLFIITCNEVGRLNQYLLNRPGRFHYHFITESPSGEEIREYMTDKLLPEHHHLIEKLTNLAAGANFTYDCLRAIAFELNRGYDIEETLADLNIIKDDFSAYDVHVLLEDGTREVKRGWRIDVYDDTETYATFGTGFDNFEAWFVPADAQYVYELNCFVLPGDKVRVENYYDKDDIKELRENGKNEIADRIENRRVVSIEFVRPKRSSRNFYI